MEEKRNYHEPCTCNQPGPAPCPRHKKQPCNGSKGNCFCLPPKVVPVEVDGCPILFRKVEIPASVGDETTNPPEPGLYRNVLLYYEATGNTYLYSSDGMPTKLPPKGDKGDQGEQGPQGPTGPAGPQGPQGETGPQGIQGEQGPQGPAGEDGAGIEIAGTVATYANLPTNLGPDDEGKGYYVEDEGTLYIWNGTAFPADGDGVHIQGPQGPQGIQGVQGPQGIQGIQGPAGADGADGVSPTATVTQTATGATITITDAQGTTTADIRNGEDGNVPIATTSVAGKVKPDGTTITVTADGTISSAAAYTLPPATTSTLGGVIVGNNLTVAANGTLDATDTTYTAGTNVQISAGNVISATDTTYSAFAGATSSVAGTAGLVPAPTTSDPDKYLKGDGTWAALNTDPNIVEVYQKYVGSTWSGLYYDQACTEWVGAENLYNLVKESTVLVHEGEWGDVGTIINAFEGSESGYNFMVIWPDNSAGIYTSTLQMQDDNLNPDTYYYAYRYDWYLQEQLTAGSNITISNHTISATDTTYSAFTGATSSVAGSAGLVPAPTTSDPDKFLKGDGTWSTLPAANNINATDWNALWQ